MFDAIAANNESFSGGFIEHHAERYTVRGIGLVTGTRDLERVVLASHQGVPVLLRRAFNGCPTLKLLAGMPTM